jgi:hypothetical protein
LLEVTSYSFWHLLHQILPFFGNARALHVGQNI